MRRAQCRTIEGCFDGLVVQEVVRCLPRTKVESKISNVRVALMPEALKTEARRRWQRAEVKDIITSG